MSVNYDRVCRLCLSSRSELLPIFSTTSSDDSDPPVLASKIKDCVAIQINENDDLPTNVCRKCLDNVNNWHIFKSVCERTQNKLQSLIKKDGSQLEEVNVKSEPLSDEAYDDTVVIDGGYPENEDAANKVQPEGPPILASLGLTPRSDKNYVDPRMDWQRVHAILNLVQDDEVIDSLQSTEECDVIHVSDHDSDSDTDLQEVLPQFIDYKNGYICKNSNVISRHPKVSSDANITKIRDAIKLRKRKMEQPYRRLPKPRDAWQLLFTDDLLDLIVTATNENILRNSRNVADITNLNEIRTVIGLLYFHGIMRPTHPRINDLWHPDLGIDCVKNAMKYSRFKFILKNLCFDTQDDSINELDAMKRIRKAFEIFTFNCRTAYNIDNTVVIDEVIIPTYGPCSFRYDLMKKQLKTGLKMVMLVDSTNLYISNLDIITDPFFRADEIVTKLVQHLHGKGCTIIMDSWYTSIDLIQKLRKEYQLFSIAALNPKDEIIPPLFVSENRKCRTYLTGFIDEDIALTSYHQSRTHRVVNVVANEPKYYKRGHLNTTTAVSAYKKNQSIVEVIDVLMHYYTTMQNVNNWTMSIFFTLLNIGAVNAQVIWTADRSASQGVPRRLFIKDLAISLLETETIPEKRYKHIPAKMRNVSLLPDVGMHQSRGRCKICRRTTKRDRKSRVTCIKCGIFICGEHTVTSCLCVACHSSEMDVLE